MSRQDLENFYKTFEKKSKKRKKDKDNDYDNSKHRGKHDMEAVTSSKKADFYDVAKKAKKGKSKGKGKSSC